MLKLKKESLDWALEHAISRGDTDIFPPCFELQAIKEDWDRLREELSEEDVLNWKARPCRRCLSPKHRYGFRVSTQLDPLDFLVYTSLVYEIGEDIESQRVPTSSECVFSYRFLPDDNGRFFDENIGYTNFIEKTRQLVDSGKYTHIVVADIADFYPRIYSHRVQNALSRITDKKNHVLAIMNLLAQWNEHISYGIPVGCATSRLLAEAAIDDIDRALLGESTMFLRFNDDFRIFCKSSVEAHAKLAFLANLLFENHGLTLQQHKTRIFPMDEFRKTPILSDEETELKSLSDKFYELADKLGLEDLYGYIDYDSLEPDQQAAIDSLNLLGILEEQFERDEVDIPLTRFVLRRLGQLEDTSAIKMIFDSMEKLYPVITSVAQYFARLRKISKEDKEDLGKRVAELLRSNLIAHLEFHRMWLLTLFTSDKEWGDVSNLIKLFNENSDEFSRRKIVLALGCCNVDYWFRANKRNFFNFPIWVRRALLVGGRCLPTDERKHWYKSLEPRLDTLERAVLSWSKTII